MTHQFCPGEDKCAINLLNNAGNPAIKEISRRRCRRGVPLSLVHCEIRPDRWRNDVNFSCRHSLGASHFASINRPAARKDKLALVSVQFAVELAVGERQCFLYISNPKATSPCTSSFVTSSAHLSMRATCVRAIAFPRAANLPPCWGFTEPQWQMLMRSWNPKA